jgi:hypothetical protein
MSKQRNVGGGGSANLNFNAFIHLFKININIELIIDLIISFLYEKSFEE